MRKALVPMFLITVGMSAARAYAQPIIGGFVEASQAVRIDENAVLGDDGLGQRSYPRSELRVQLTAREAGDREDLFVRVDIISDATGAAATIVDLREAYIKWTRAGGYGMVLRPYAFPRCANNHFGWDPETGEVTMWNLCAEEPHDYDGNGNVRTTK